MPDNIVFVGGAMIDSTYLISEAQLKEINKRLPKEIPPTGGLDNDLYPKLKSALDDLGYAAQLNQPGGSINNTKNAMESIGEPGTFNYTHVVTSNGHGLHLNLPGGEKWLSAKKPQDPVELTEDTKRKIQEAKAVFIPHSTFTDRPEVAEAIINHVRASGSNAKIIATFHGCKFDKLKPRSLAALNEADAWIGNNEELGMKELADSVKAFTSDPSRVAVITDGERGVEIISGAYREYFPTKKVEPCVDSSGAGNAAEGALVLFFANDLHKAQGLERMKNFQELGTLINAAGGHACTFKGAMMQPTPENNTAVWSRFQELKVSRESLQQQTKLSGPNLKL